MSQTKAQKNQQRQATKLVVTIANNTHASHASNKQTNKLITQRLNITKQTKPKLAHCTKNSAKGRKT